MAVGAMKTKETAVMWKNLENACSLVLGCIVASVHTTMDFVVGQGPLQTLSSIPGIGLAYTRW